jgi:hypothetical protein
MNDQELKDLWRRQKTPATDARPQIEALRKKTSNLQAGLNARDFRELAAGAVVIIIFGLYFIMNRHPGPRIGALIVIAGTLVVSWKIMASRRRVPHPDAGAPVALWLKQERERVHSQAELLRTVLWWYLLPSWLGTNVFFWGLPNLNLALKLAFTGVNTLMCAWIHWLNQSARRKQLLPIQDELEVLLQEESPAGQAGAPPSATSVPTQEANLSSPADPGSGENRANKSTTTPEPQTLHMKTTMRNIAWLACSFCAGLLLCYGVLHRSPPAQPPVQTPTRDAGNQPDATMQRSFDTLLAATTADDYDQFIAVLGGPGRSRITPAAFHSLSQSLAPRLQRGCTATYLGQLRQNGVQVSLWRLAFADGGDEILARMSLSQNQVNGFLVTPAF